MTRDDPRGSDVLVRARGLRVGFGKAAILPPIDFEVRRRELWGVIGRNGAGKTTLFRTLLGLHPAVGGEVGLAPAAVLGYVPQRFTLDPLVPARAKDLIVEGSDRATSFLRPLRTVGARERIARAIEATNTEPLLRRRYRDLSEGEKQRVLLARAMAGAPDLLVLDEPTSAMDVVAEREVIEVLRELRRRFSIGILLVSHHLNLVAQIADRMLFLDADEGLAVTGTVAEVTGHSVFLHRYGAVLAEAATPAIASVRPPAPASTPAPPEAAGSAERS